MTRIIPDRCKSTAKKPDPDEEARDLKADTDREFQLSGSEPNRPRMTDVDRGVLGMIREIVANPGDMALRLILSDLLQDYLLQRPGPETDKFLREMDPLRSERGCWRIVSAPYAYRANSVPREALEWHADLGEVATEPAVLIEDIVVPPRKRKITKRFRLAISSDGFGAVCSVEGDVHEQGVGAVELLADEASGWKWVCLGSLCDRGENPLTVPGLERED